jgi:hypothetical protein
LLVAEGGVYSGAVPNFVPGGISVLKHALSVVPGGQTGSSVSGAAGSPGQKAGLIITTQVTSAGALGGSGHNLSNKGLFQNTALNVGEGGGTVGPKDAATAAIAASDVGAGLPWFGDGAPSGGSSITTNAGAGASGAAPGGGGSGGGACDNTHTSGAGGQGARGAVRVWEFG